MNNLMKYTFNELFNATKEADIVFQIFSANFELWKEQTRSILFTEFLKKRCPGLSFTERNQLIINDSHFDHNNYF